jgi:hypothetical protein
LHTATIPLTAIAEAFARPNTDRDGLKLLVSPNFAELTLTMTDTTPLRRRAITRWDFSWLLRRDHDEAKYADVPRVLDELAERGYDVVRIDASRAGSPQQRPTLDHRMWPGQGCRHILHA